MAKNTRAAEADKEQPATTPDGAAAPAKKAGLVGKLLGPVLALPKLLLLLNPLKILKLPRKMQLVAVAAILLIAGGGGAAWFLLGGAESEEVADAHRPKPLQITQLPSENTSFFDVPDIIVNIQTPDGSPAFLKLVVSLEVDQPDAQALIEPVLPRVIDQFQTYLRELRVEDIRGSAGVMRLKEELLRRVNFALAPLPVRDVLLKEMIVQ